MVWVDVFVQVFMMEAFDMDVSFQGILRTTMQHADDVLFWPLLKSFSSGASEPLGRPDVRLAFSCVALYVSVMIDLVRSSF